MKEVAKETDTLELPNIINTMAMEVSHTILGTDLFIMGNGKVGKRRALELIGLQTVITTWDSGRRITRMVMEF